MQIRIQILILGFKGLKKMAVEPEKHKDGLENDGKAGEVSSVMSVVQISI